VFGLDTTRTYLGCGLAHRRCHHGNEPSGMECPEQLSYFHVALLFIVTVIILIRTVRQNCCVSGLCPSVANILENTKFRKLDLFLFSGEGREIATLLDPLELTSITVFRI
jgi:hypothetical protein